MAQFTLSTRKTLAAHLKLGTTYRDIKKIVEKAISSISEEVNKNGGITKYCPFEAEKRAQKSKIKIPQRQHISLRHDDATYRLESGHLEFRMTFYSVVINH